MRETARASQLTREWRLLRELQRVPEGRTYRELARALGAAPRTVYRDLRTLQDAGFPLRRARVQLKSVWRIEGAAVPPLAFTGPELTALALARSALAGSPGSPFDRPLRQAFHKIQAALDREGVRALEAADRHVYADLRRGRPYTQREVWFQTVLDAVFRHRTLRLRYFTLERGAETDRTVDPYGLVLHEGAFYLVGWCHWRRDVRTFLLERVRAVADGGASFEPPAGFSVREHFRQAWGLLKGHILITVRVRFAPAVGRVIREGRWHESQRVEELPGGAALLTVRVAGWEEMRRWILGFGAAAEVLEPEELRESMKLEAANLARLYGGRRRGSTPRH